MRRPRHQCCERNAGIDPVAVHSDIELQPVDPVERKPFDGLGPGRLAEVAQQPAPGGDLQLPAPIEVADRRVKTLAQAGLGRIFGILETAAQHAAKPFQRRCEALEAVGEPQRS